MNKYILTGTPGSGKTTLIHALEIKGAQVVHEAATDLIALRQAQGITEPWKEGRFIQDIVKLQKQREPHISNNQKAVFFDRSPFCTYALATFLEHPYPKVLTDEIHRMLQNSIYEKTVFFIENLGKIDNTNARQITLQDALKFENIHLETYKKFGFECKIIPKAPIDERLKMISSLIKH